MSGSKIVSREPKLGLATTKELIDELAARADVSSTNGEAWPAYWTAMPDAPPAATPAPDAIARFVAAQRDLTDVERAALNATRDEMFAAAPSAVSAPDAPTFVAPNMDDGSALTFAMRACGITAENEQSFADGFVAGMKHHKAAAIRRAEAFIAAAAPAVSAPDVAALIARAPTPKGLRSVTSTEWFAFSADCIAMLRHLSRALKTVPVDKPAESFPVGSFVLEEIEARGWTLDDLATRMGGEFAVSRLSLDFLIACHDEPKMHIGEHMAWQLAIAFGTSAELFLNLDAAHRRYRAQLEQSP